MSRHVDRTRPEDAPGRHSGWSGNAQAHRKPGDPTMNAGTYFQDVWSGDPDTDRAWAHEPAPYVCHGRIGWDN